MADTRYGGPVAVLPPAQRPRRRALRPSHGATAAIVAVVLLATASPARSAIERTTFLSDLDFPTNMAFAPDGRLFFTEKDTGNVRVANDGETGMLGVALDPAFEREPWVYVYFSDAASGNNVLVRVRDEGGRAGARQTLGSFLPWAAGYHNGGDLLFGADRKLYVAVGEAHDPERAQDPRDVGGKILRLSPDGSIPPDNPIAGSPAFTIGHRNSFGLCLEPDSGDIWETENGPDVDDEVNVLRAGANYGWPEVTGDSGGRFEDPVAIFPSPEALTGCAVWRGDLWFGAANTGAVYRMPVDRRGVAPQQAAGFDAPVIDVAVGPDDALYVATASAIVRLTDDEPAPTRSASPTDGANGEPTEAGPVVMPEREGSGGGASAAVPIVAAAILAAALWVRMRAGRALRSSEDPAEPGDP
jgi:glucose/arabinose dehydrogenase